MWLHDGQICFKASVGSLARNGRVKVRRIQGERREKALKGRKKNRKEGDRGGEEVVSKMALQENTLHTKADNLNLIPGTKGMKGENQLSNFQL